MTISKLFLCMAMARAVVGGSLSDIKHVVMIMFENRSFDHYFGTMAGVRGFADPNVQVNPSTGLNTFQQIVTSDLSNETTVLLPWQADYLGGNWSDAVQCTWGGSNAWTEVHYALNNDQNDQWVTQNTPWSMMYYLRDTIPVHFGIAEGFTVADMYQQSVVAVTNPNRVFWMGGSINVPGGKQTSDEGGTILQNACATTCDSDNPVDCCPLKWKSVGEYVQEAGASWRLYQGADDMAYQNIFVRYFEGFQDSSPGEPLYDNGVGYYDNSTYDQFIDDAMNGNLPTVSWLIGPGVTTEHPPRLPNNGAWLQKYLVDAITKGKSWNDTVLMISYDEEGGWYDHVTPFHSPQGTPGEWMNDPYGDFGEVYAGPGHRVPFYIISPWTRGGRVFTEHADHTSQILFLEKFLQANGHNDFKIDEISDWRRAHMSDLVNAFDFDNPDFSQPDIPDVANPEVTGNYTEMTNYQAECYAMYPDQPPVPYGSQDTLEELAKKVEQGFKPMRGNLTEGRYITLELNGFALTNPADGTNQFSVTPATEDHADLNQRWIVHQLDIANNTQTFHISSAVDGRWISQHTSLSNSESGAQDYTVTFLGNGKGYTLQKQNGKYLGVDQSGNIVIQSQPAGFQLYAVTYTA